MSDSIGLGKHKATMIDELHSGAKATWISADNFALDRGNLSSTVQVHADTLEALSSSHKALQQQVQAISRIIEASNLPKLQERVKLNQDDWARNLKRNLEDTVKELMGRVEAEVAEVTNAKVGLSNRMDGVESRLTEQFRIKIEEVNTKVYQNKDTIEKVIVTADNAVDTAAATHKAMQALEMKFADVKKDLRSMESRNDLANSEQDRVVATLTSDVRVSLEAAQSKIIEEGRSLTRMIQKREYELVDEVASIRDMLEKESSERMDMHKSVQNWLNESVNKFKADIQSKLEKAESALDLKVKNCVTANTDVKRMVEEEAIHRETADKEVARRLVKEANDREQDEARLVGLISVMQGALAKMNKNIG